MGIFDRNKKELPPLFSEQELEDLPAVDFNSVITYLEGLSDEDYVKVMDVAAIYRKANKDASAALGTANEPTTFINPPEPEPRVTEPAYADKLANDMLADDELDFLEDEPKPKKTTKKVRVNH